MENKGAATAAAAQENKEAAVAPAPASCFKKATVAKDATFVEAAKEQLKQFKEAPLEEHWSCIKNKVRSVFADFGDFGVPGKDNKTAPSVES